MREVRQAGHRSGRHCHVLWQVCPVVLLLLAITRLSFANAHFEQPKEADAAVVQKQEWLECLSSIQQQQISTPEQDRQQQQQQQQGQQAQGQGEQWHRKRLLDSLQQLPRQLASTRSRRHCSQLMFNYLTSGYKFMVPLRERLRGLAHVGDRERTRRAIHKLVSGQPFKLVILGGSITAGHGAYHNTSLSWPNRLASWLTDHFPNARVHNGATPGMGSDYMSVCVQAHCPMDADMVLLEFAINDAGGGPTIEGHRGMERLIRKLLMYPNNPSVVVLSAYSWGTYQGMWWMNQESATMDMALYYGLPVVSVKAALYHLFQRNITGFRVDKNAHDQPDADKDNFFFSDDAHPYATTGHRAFAELVMAHFMHNLRFVVAQPVQQWEDLMVKGAPLPPPVIPNNWPAVNNTCLVGKFFQNSVVYQQGFEWLNDSQQQERPKWGYISTLVGSVIKFRVSLALSGGESTPGTAMSLQLAHLKSYEHMGQASISCEEGCTCGGQFDGHDASRKESQIHMFEFPVQPKAEVGPSCVVVVTVLPGTNSKEHKVKVTSLVVMTEDTNFKKDHLGATDIERLADTLAVNNGTVYELQHNVAMNG